MKNSFSEVKLFQAKLDKLEEFETLVSAIASEQKKQNGCIDIKYVKRFYTIDRVEKGNAPRELTKIVKYVKYFSYWEFDSKENYGKAIDWFFNKRMEYGPTAHNRIVSARPLRGGATKNRSRANALCAVFFRPAGK